MALKQLLIGKKISDLRAQMETLLQTRDNLVTRHKARLVGWRVWVDTLHHEAVVSVLTVDDGYRVV